MEGSQKLLANSLFKCVLWSFFKSSLWQSISSRCSGQLNLTLSLMNPTPSKSYGFNFQNTQNGTISTLLLLLPWLPARPIPSSAARVWRVKPCLTQSLLMARKVLQVLTSTLSLSPVILPLLLPLKPRCPSCSLFKILLHTRSTFSLPVLWSGSLVSRNFYSYSELGEVFFDHQFRIVTPSPTLLFLFVLFLLFS